jgi:hypothetical protein
MLVERGRLRWFVMRCPCGCGEELPVNLDPDFSDAWRLYGDAETGFSLFPSVWRTTGCKSHFVVWRNQIFLFDKYDYETEGARPTESLKSKVKGGLKRGSLTSFADLAEVLKEIPWDVLAACRALVREGTAIEGRGGFRGRFRLLDK